MVLGMQKWGSEWWDKVVSEGRDKNSSGVVIGMDRRGLVSATNKKEWDSKYTRVPNVRGNATIFHPGLAHGSPAPVPRERILILPWFVRPASSSVSRYHRAMYTKRNTYFSNSSAAAADVLGNHTFPCQRSIVNTVVMFESVDNFQEVQQALSQCCRTMSSRV
jgi:hypothetical protein